MKNSHLRTTLGQIKERADLIEKYLTGDYDCYTKEIGENNWMLDDNVQFDSFESIEYKLVKKKKWADLREKYETGDYICFAKFPDEDDDEWDELYKPDFESERLEYKLVHKHQNIIDAVDGGEKVEFRDKVYNNGWSVLECNSSYLNFKKYEYRIVSGELLDELKKLIAKYE